MEIRDIEEIMAAKTERGGWTKATLSAWGVPWPPPKGWKRALLNGKGCNASTAERVTGAHVCHSRLWAGHQERETVYSLPRNRLDMALCAATADLVTGGTEAESA